MSTTRNTPTPLQSATSGAIPRSSRVDARTIFFLGLLLAAGGAFSPALALAAGITFALACPHPYRLESHTLAKLLLQISVVALGFGMNLHEVVQAGRAGFLYTAVSICCALALGLAFGKLLRIGGKASFLISAGTAICGGSAIAALAPITEPNEEEISIAMGTVFVLNSVALFLFPAIGAWLHLDQKQFGLWAALAIHDTSSVVGAAAKYGPQALAIGTTVKLARALWILPLSLLTAAWMQRMRARALIFSTGALAQRPAKITIPWFIGLFGVAAAIRTYLPGLTLQYAQLTHLGRSGLTATLFLIGTGLSAQTIRSVGIRPFLQGIALWVLVATLSLAAIYYRWISV